MGRFFGRRPDRTPAIARAMQARLDPGETVLAGVDVQVPGTSSAALAGGASAATSTAVGPAAPTFRDGDETAADWAGEATAMGAEAAAVGKVVWASVVLTSTRVLVVRRSRLSGRLRDIVAQWPLHDVDRIDVPRQGQRLSIHRGDQQLDFELDLAPRFRPEDSAELPSRLAAAKSDQHR